MEKNSSTGGGAESSIISAIGSCVENTNFPKYQISKFHDRSRDLQSVFRTNDKAEYEAQLKEWLKEQEIDEVIGVSTPTTQPPPKPDLPPKPAEYCPDCGAVKVMGKKGLYCKSCYIAWAKENKPKTY